MLKCPSCGDKLELIRESRGMLKSGKPSKVMVEKLSCRTCGKQLRDNAPYEAGKWLKK